MFGDKGDSYEGGVVQVWLSTGELSNPWYTVIGLNAGGNKLIADCQSEEKGFLVLKEFDSLEEAEAYARENNLPFPAKSW